MFTQPELWQIYLRFRNPPTLTSSDTIMQKHLDAEREECQRIAAKAYAEHGKRLKDPEQGTD